MDIVINSCLEQIPEGGVPIVNQGHYYHNLLLCLGYPISSPPVADLLRQLHGLEGEWLVVSPLHWQATHNDAMIIAVSNDLRLTEEEGHAWFDAFAAFVAADGVNAYYHDAYTWLIQSDTFPKIQAKPVGLLLHKSMMPQLETLDNTFFWQRFITEIQMFLSGHGLNKQRKGRYSVNGVWIWGAGVLQRSKQCIVPHDPETESLARLVSSNIQHVSNMSISEISQYDTKLKRLPDNTIFLYSDLSSLSELQCVLRKKLVSWYWNNHAYQVKPKHWIKSLWRKLC